MFQVFWVVTLGVCLAACRSEVDKCVDAQLRSYDAGRIRESQAATIPAYVEFPDGNTFPPYHGKERLPKKWKVKMSDGQTLRVLSDRQLTEPQIEIAAQKAIAAHSAGTAPADFDPAGVAPAYVRGFKPAREDFEAGARILCMDSGGVR